MEIQSSIHVALESTHATELRELPLPSWLRIARSAYLGAAVTLLLAPTVLPAIGEYIGIGVIQGRYSGFSTAMLQCCFLTSILGLVIGTLLASHGSRWSIPVLASVVLLMFIALPSLGR